jgi:hypothetical protein
MDRHPIPDLFAMLPYEMPPYLVHDVEAGTKLMTAGVALDNPEWLKGFLVQNARQMGMAGKILFPVPDRGLSDRLYRIKAKTLWCGAPATTHPPSTAKRSRKRSKARSSTILGPATS